MKDCVWRGKVFFSSFPAAHFHKEELKGLKYKDDWIGDWLAFKIFLLLHCQFFSQ